MLSNNPLSEFNQSQVISVSPLASLPPSYRKFGKESIASHEQTYRSPFWSTVDHNSKFRPEQ